MKKIVVIVLLAFCVFINLNTVVGSTAGFEQEFNYSGEGNITDALSNYNVYSLTAGEGQTVSITEDNKLKMTIDETCGISSNQVVRIRNESIVYNNPNVDSYIETGFEVTSTYRKTIQIYVETVSTDGTTIKSSSYTLLSFVGNSFYYNLGTSNQTRSKTFSSNTEYVLTTYLTNNEDGQGQVSAYLNGELLYQDNIVSGYGFTGKLVELSYTQVSPLNSNEHRLYIDYLKVGQYVVTDFVVSELKNSLKLNYTTTDLGYEITNTSLRFGVSLTESEYESYSDLTKFGMLATLTSKLGSNTIEELFIESEATTIEEFNKYLIEQEIIVNNLELSKSELSEANETGTAWESGDKYYQYSMVIENIPTENYDTSFTAVAYYIIDGKIYFGDERSNSVSLVATEYKTIDIVMNDSILSALINLIAPEKRM